MEKGKGSKAIQLFNISLPSIMHFAYTKYQIASNKQEMVLPYLITNGPHHLHHSDLFIQWIHHQVHKQLHPTNHKTLTDNKHRSPNFRLFCSTPPSISRTHTNGKFNSEIVLDYSFKDHNPFWETHPISKIKIHILIKKLKGEKTTLSPPY